MNLETNKEYSVKWKNHMSHVRQAFDQLLTSSELTDVTLSCEGQKIGAHKVLLSACSGYFRDTFKQVPCQHPVIILYGIQYNVLMDILHFIYNGEVSVDNSRLDTFLKIAKLLQISGLSDDLPEDTPMSHNETDEDAIKPEQITTELAVASDEGNSVTEPTSHDNRKCAKRSRPVESDTNEVRLLHKEKMQRQEDDALFLSDVKAEPSELISFDETLEDPLLQAEQPPDTNEFYGAAESTGGQEEYKNEGDGPSDNHHKQAYFVQLLEKHKILLDKSQLPVVRKAKEDALQQLKEEWQKEIGRTISEKQLQKKINNMKAFLKAKVSRKRRGRLYVWEKKFLQLLQYSGAKTKDRPPRFDEHDQVAYAAHTLDLGF